MTRMASLLTRLRNAIRRIQRTEPAQPGIPERQMARDFAAALAPRGASAPSPPAVQGALWSYFSSHREGRGIWKWSHYFDAYERHLGRFAGRAPHIVEIGIYSGGSLEMWRQYFGGASRVTGIDIQEACRAYSGEGIEIDIGDQADREFWRAFRQRRPHVDIVIDDGGHTPEQQRITLEEMLPHVAPGGVYICEDVHGIGNPFAAYVHELADAMNGFEGVQGEELSSAAGALQREIASIHFYPFLIVIEKTAEPVRRFVAPKRGTSWEPFLS